MHSSMIRVPASTANVGPAFDSMAVALSPTLTCTVTEIEEGFSISASGVDAGLIPADTSNMILKTACKVGTMYGRSLPPLRVDLFNEIPLGKGLGSSAAARVAGVVMADSVLKLGLTRAEVLEHVAGMEGHADNAAAAVFGGCMVCGQTSGRLMTARMPFPCAVQITLLIPEFILETEKSRKALPDTYPRSTVVSGISQTGLLVAALANGDLQLLASALTDKIHQPYRAALVPGMAEALAFRMDGLLGCTLSGAGPSLVVLTHKDHHAVASRVQSLLVETSQSHWTLRHLTVAENGYCVISGVECYV